MRIINIPVAIFILILIILLINGYEVHSVLYAPSIFLGFGKPGHAGRIVDCHAKENMSEKETLS